MSAMTMNIKSGKKCVITVTPLIDRLNSQLRDACMIGDRNLVMAMLGQGADNWDDVLRLACKEGDIDLALSMIEKGANDWNGGLIDACVRGHMDLVLLMIGKGASQIALDLGLEAACWGGHQYIALLMIKQGASNWNWGLGGACRGGHKDLILLMIKNGADPNRALTFYWPENNKNLSNKDLIPLLVENGADLCKCPPIVGDDLAEYLIRRKVKGASTVYPRIAKQCVEANKIVQNSGVIEVKDILLIINSY